MMTMHSRSTRAQPEITSYVADSFAPYERLSTDLRQESKKISRAWRTLKISLRENMEENADRPESRRAGQKQCRSMAGQIFQPAKHLRPDRKMDYSGAHLKGALWMSSV